MTSVVGGWFDHHCHLTHDRIGPDVVADAFDAGILGMITVGCDVQDSRDQIEIARPLTNVWATAGVHPHEASNGIAGLEELLSEPEVVAVGECGLDYHYDNSPREIQRECFAAQIRLAHAHEMALVIHSRSAWDDTFEILRSEGMPERTVFHCFSGGAAEAELALELGAKLSFSGIITFRSATDLQEAAKLCPLNELLVETDSPYLAPVPFRGKANSPANVAHVGTEIARLKEIEPQAVALATSANVCDLYQIEPSKLAG